MYKRSLFHSVCWERLWGQNNGYSGLFPWRQIDRGIRLTTYLHKANHLSPWRMNGNTSRFPVYGRYRDWLQAGRSGDRIPVGARFFAPVQTCPGAYPTSYTMGTGSLPGVKQLGCSVYYPPLSSAEVKERVELYLCSPFGPSLPVLGWTVTLSLPSPVCPHALYGGNCAFFPLHKFRELSVISEFRLFCSPFFCVSFSTAQNFKLVLKFPSYDRYLNTVLLWTSYSIFSSYVSSDATIKHILFPGANIFLYICYPYTNKVIFFWGGMGGFPDH
jgi:hypothetical protein